MNKTLKWFTTVVYIFSATACSLYVWVFLVISNYRDDSIEIIRDLPIYARIIFNIYQPFLVVFVLVSLAFPVLINLTGNKSNKKRIILFCMVIFNVLFSLVLLLLSIFRNSPDSFWIKSGSIHPIFNSLVWCASKQLDHQGMWSERTTAGCFSGVIPNSNSYSYQQLISW